MSADVILLVTYILLALVFLLLYFQYPEKLAAVTMWLLNETNGLILRLETWIAPA